VAEQHRTVHGSVVGGQFALKGIEVAFCALNDHFGTPGPRGFNSGNTIAIAAAASNGAGAALRALEDDDKELIDGLVVTEPNIGPRPGPFAIRFGDDPLFDPAGRSIYDAITLMGTYASRAAQDWGVASHEVLNLWRSLHPTYAAAYGRFAVWEKVCDVSFAATDATGLPAPLPEALAKRLFADSSGIPATGGINLIADSAQNGPILENLAVSPSTGRADRAHTTHSTKWRKGREAV
jgi:hydroxybutyrate-dimer hydrolase